MVSSGSITSPGKPLSAVPAFGAVEGMLVLGECTLVLEGVALLMAEGSVGRG